MSEIKISPYFIDSFVGTLASPEPKHEDEVAAFDGTNQNEVKAMLKNIVLPSFNLMNPWSKESAKQTLKYYINLKDFRSLRWVLEDIANEKGEYDDAMFWASMWETLFNDESPILDSLEGYIEVLDQSEAHEYKKNLYEDFIKSKRGG